MTLIQAEQVLHTKSYAFYHVIYLQSPISFFLQRKSIPMGPIGPHNSHYEMTERMLISSLVGRQVDCRPCELNLILRMDMNLEFLQSNFNSFDDDMTDITLFSFMYINNNKISTFFMIEFIKYVLNITICIYF